MRRAAALGLGLLLAGCGASAHGDDDGVGVDACAACVCQPGTGTCTGDVSHACRADGSGYDDVYCDPVQGLACGASGLCEGPCAPAALGESYLGCSFWPTVTGNLVSQQYAFAVSVSNAGDAVAYARIDGGALAAPATFPVPGHATVVRTLPWVAALKLCVGASQFDCTTGYPTAARAVRGAYHLRTTLPVTVYQFNPLDFDFPGATEHSYSNDASLLLPATAWRGDVYVASFAAHVNQFVAYPSLFAVTAQHDGTTVTIDPRASTAAAGDAPAFTAGVAQQVTLDAGDVLELGTAAGDLTGSRVTADRPVQVIGGHYCAQIPDAYSFCDHLEESMFPVDTLSNRYVVVAPATVTVPAGKEETVRIVATADGTTVDYDPPVAGAPGAIAHAGDFLEIPRTAASFVVTANHKVLVAQYMEGGTVSDPPSNPQGDPSMALAVPIDQYRDQYLFHAPVNYTTNYVDVIARTGTVVTLDGVDVAGFQPIGSTGYGYARVAGLGPGLGSDGNHAIRGTGPFAISVYGYGQDTSYWYPGGLDLKRVP